MPRITSNLSNTHPICELCDPENPSQYIERAGTPAPLLCFRHLGESYRQGDPTEKSRVRALLVIEGGAQRRRNG
jgi:hypothetical protein